LCRAIWSKVVSDGMLHPGVSHNDEESADPRSHKNGEGRPPMSLRTKLLLAVKKETEECRLEEEGEHALHGERLPDDSSGKAREVRPVRPKLKFHRDAGHDAKHEVNAKDSRPKT